MSPQAPDPPEFGLPPGAGMLDALELPALVCGVHDATFPVRWVSGSFSELTGVSAADVAGHPLRSVFTTGGTDVVAAVSAKRVHRADARVRGADGLERRMEVVTTVVTGPDDGPEWVVVMLHDVTDRQLAYHEASTMMRRIRALVETAPVVSYVADWSAEAALRYISPQIEQLLGYPPEEWIHGRGMWGKHLHPDDRERIEALQLESFATETPFDVMYRMVDRYGNTKRIWERETIVRGADGHPRYSHGVLIDVTERPPASGLVGR